MSNYKPYGTVDPIILPADDGRGVPEMTCYDIYGDNTAARQSISPQEKFLQDAIMNEDNLFRWAQLAYQIFESNPACCWNHSGKTWEQNFGGDPNYMDLIDCLLNKKGKTKDKNGDVYMSSGLVLTDNLANVEQAAGKMIETLLSRKLKADSFIERCPLDPLRDNNKSQTVFYTIATHLDRYGGTYQYCYNSFGLAFYNFRLKLIAGDQPFNTALGDMTVEEAIKKGNVPGFTYQKVSQGESIKNTLTNPSGVDAVQTSEAGIEVIESETNSITDSEEYSFSEMTGVSLELSDLFGIEKLALEMQFTAEQVMNTAVTHEELKQEDKSRMSSVTVTIPADTEISVIQAEDDAVTTLQYDCPVMVQFDVAVFGLNGTFYDDNAAVHTFNTAGYDQHSFITLFEASEDGDGGVDGSENLYLRYHNYAIINGYEKVHGTTQVKSHNQGLLGTELDWDTIMKQSPASTGCEPNDAANKTMEIGTLLENTALNRPMSVTGAAITQKAQGFSARLSDPEPLYPLKKIILQSGQNYYDIGVHDKIDTIDIVLEPLDSKGYPYYVGQHIDGKWILVDENDHELNDKNPVARIENGVVVEGLRPGVAYLKWLIPENKYGYKDGTYATNDSIETVRIKITVSDQ